MSVTELNKDNFEKEVMEANVPVLIDFWASWCGPCRMMSPVIEKIAEEMGEKLKVCKVNVDENHELAEKYEIKHCSIKSILLTLHSQNANTNSLIKIIISNGNKN